MPFADFIANVGASLDEFGKNQLGPALAEAGKNLDDFGKNHLGPAIASATSAIDQFGKQTLAPALAEAGKNLEEFGRDTLVPALADAGKGLDEFGRTHVGPALGDVGKGLEEFGRNTLVPVFGELVCPALNETGKWISANPMLAASILGMVAPGIVSGPALWVFGFGSKGPIAGSAAASIQAAAGSVPAGGVFATAQSAAMGGYGSSVASGIVRVVSVGFGAIAGLFGGNQEDTKEEKE